MPTYTDVVSYSVEIGTTATPIFPPQAATTTTTPATVPALHREFRNGASVAFQVPSGGGNILLGSASRQGYQIPAGEERAVDLTGSQTRLYAKASTGTITVEVLLAP